MARLIIFANGLVPDLESARHLFRPGDVLYAVDGGTRHALALGLMPSVVIGDLDSLTQDDRQCLDAGGVEIKAIDPMESESPKTRSARSSILGRGRFSLGSISRQDSYLRIWSL